MKNKLLVDVWHCACYAWVIIDNAAKTFKEETDTRPGPCACVYYSRVMHMQLGLEARAGG